MWLRGGFHVHFLYITLGTLVIKGILCIDFRCWCVNSLSVHALRIRLLCFRVGNYHALSLSFILMAGSLIRRLFSLIKFLLFSTYQHNLFTQKPTVVSSRQQGQMFWFGCNFLTCSIVNFPIDALDRIYLVLELI